MAELMEASELMIAKSGGATTSEGLVMSLPMVVMHPIPGQEARNAALLKARNAAFFVDKPEQIRLVMRAILQEPHLYEEKLKAIQSLARPNATQDLVSLVLRGFGHDGS